MEQNTQENEHFKRRDNVFYLDDFTDSLFYEIQKRNLKPCLSGNAFRTTRIITEGPYERKIRIEAPIYDIDKYFDEGIIEKTGKGSYAESLDIDGGWSGKHKNYIDSAIKKASKSFRFLHTIGNIKVKVRYIRNDK